MPLQSLTRRLVLQAAGGAFGTLAGSGILAELASTAASTAASRPLRRSLIARTLLYPEDHVGIMSGPIRISRFPDGIPLETDPHRKAALRV